MFSVSGLLSEISANELLQILGVGELRHVSLLQTKSLSRIILTDDWMKSGWPWDINHLYTVAGDRGM